MSNIVEYAQNLSNYHFAMPTNLTEVNIVYIDSYYFHWIYITNKVNFSFDKM